jgi:hypothetical protein
LGNRSFVLYQRTTILTSNTVLIASRRKCPVASHFLVSATDASGGIRSRSTEATQERRYENKAKKADKDVDGCDKMNWPCRIGEKGCCGQRGEEKEV